MMSALHLLVVAFSAASLSDVARSTRASPARGGVVNSTGEAAAPALRHTVGLAEKRRRKELIVACNGYTDERTASVGVRLKKGGRGVRGLPKLNGKAAADAGAVWTRPLAFGTCEEYHLDLTGREIFFITPDGNSTCALSTGGLPSSLHRAAVLAQPFAGSSHCAVREAKLSRKVVEGGIPAAELVTVDAMAALPLEKDEFNKIVPALDGGAVIRLEDIVEDSRIASEVVGSQTLELDHDFAIEPRRFHIILEGLRGADMYDRHDVQMEEGHTYLAIRLGRAGRHPGELDEQYPLRLMVYKCESSMDDV